MLTVINLFLLFYAVPCVVNYFCLRWNYIVYEPDKSPEKDDINTIFTPALNLFCAVVFVGFIIHFYLVTKRFFHRKYAKDKKEFDYNKFFRL